MDSQVAFSDPQPCQCTAAGASKALQLQPECPVGCSGWPCEVQGGNWEEGAVGKHMQRERGKIAERLENPEQTCSGSQGADNRDGCWLPQKAQEHQVQSVRSGLFSVTCHKAVGMERRRRRMKIFLFRHSEFRYPPSYMHTYIYMYLCLSLRRVAWWAVLLHQ